MSEDGRARAAAVRARREYSYAEGGNYSDPEAAPLSERCLIGFSTTSGPVLLDAIYNSNYQIVQTPDHVMILIEMVHDARIVRLNAEHNDAAIKPWFGDSIGWWEGDTLVVETTNIHPVHASAGSIMFSEDGVLTERFTRTADDQILYAFEVDDPGFYSQTWRGEIPFRPSAGLYEYACHEGNYAMEGILRGSRLDEARAAGAGEGQ
jgi:hypothetical protein